MSDLASSPLEPVADPGVEQFGIAPLIRLTLLSLYIALTVPLPFLARATAAPVPESGLWGGVAIGLVVLYGALSERVIVDRTGIRVSYPAWIPSFLRKGWELNWSEVRSIKPKTTGQGGLVYYFVSQSAQAYLLPMRVAGFARLLRRVEAETGIETTDIKPLSQPWMYLILLGLTLMLLLIDAWTIWTAAGLG